MFTVCGDILFLMFTEVLHILALIHVGMGTHTSTHT